MQLIWSICHINKKQFFIEKDLIYVVETCLKTKERVRISTNTITQLKLHNGSQHSLEYPSDKT